MALTTFNDLIARKAAGYEKNITIGNGNGNTRTSPVNVSQNLNFTRNIYTEAIPGSLESGVTAYIPVELTTNTQAVMIIGELTNLGSLDISGASGTFTDGSVMPTRTTPFGSRQVPGMLLMEVTTALSATPGAITVTYKDQDNNTAETSVSMNLISNASVGGCTAVGVPTLNGSDWGVVDVTAASRTSGTTPTGVIKFWGFTPITTLQPASTGLGTVEDLISSYKLTRLSAGTILGGFTHNSTGTATIIGNLHIVGDN